MKKKIGLLVLSIILLVSISFAWLETGDKNAQDNTVTNVEQSEMDSILTEAGCDDTATMLDKMSSMSATEKEKYLAEQAEIMSKATGTDSTIVFNPGDGGDVSSSNPKETEKNSTVDHGVDGAKNKIVSGLDDEYKQYLAIYEKNKNNSNGDNSDEDKNTHVCDGGYAYIPEPEHTHSHPNEGPVGQWRNNTPFTSTISLPSDTSLTPLKVGSEFTLSGEKHIIRSYTQTYKTYTNSCGADFYYIRVSCSDPNCSDATTSSEYIGSCDVTYSWRVYSTPTYHDTRYGVKFSFKGFSVEGNKSIAGDVESWYGTYPKPNIDVPYSSSFKVTALDPENLVYEKGDKESGLAYGVVTVSCMCGKESVPYKIYFNLAPLPPDNTEEYTLKVQSEGKGKVRIGENQAWARSNTEELSVGSERTIWAKADEGYEFVGFYEIDGDLYSIKNNNDESYTNVKQPAYDYTIVAKFVEKDTHLVTVYSDGNGIAGINNEKTSKDNQCISVDIIEGKTVSINSVPDNGFKIDHWGKIENGVETFFTDEEDFEFPVLDDCVFIVHFKPISNDITNYKNLTVTHDGNGYTIGGTKYAEPNKKYPIWAFPNNGYEFDRWEREIKIDNEGNDDSTRVTTDYAQFDFITMPEEDYKVIACFVPDGTSERSDLEVVSDGNGDVCIDENEPGPVDKINDENGKEHEIHAIPDPGYEFENWTNEEGIIISVEKDLPVVLKEDVIYIAHFKPIDPNNKYILDVKSAGHGSVIGGTSAAEPNKDYPITANPDKGYKFSYWEKVTSDGSEKTTLPDNTYFTMPSENVKLIAHFKKKSGRIVNEEVEETYRLTVESTEGGSASGGGNFAPGDRATVTVTVNSGYRFLGWYDENGKLVSEELAYSVIMPAHDITLIAKFVAGEYNNDSNNAFIIKSIRDLRWKDYFAAANSYSYRYFNIPERAGKNTILLNSVDLEDDYYKQYRNIVYGYAVETEIKTSGLYKSQNPKLQIDYILYDQNGNNITDKVVDGEKYLHLEIDANEENKDFLTSAEETIAENNGVDYPIIAWNWIFYLPTNLKTDSGNFLYEDYEKIIVKYNINVETSVGAVKYDYIKAINHMSSSNAEASDWGGKVFTYRTRDNNGNTLTVLTDLENNLTY